jgi:hypothetical protein
MGASWWTVVMNAVVSLAAAIVVAVLSLSACTGPLPAGAGPAPQHDTPDRGGGDRGGMM